MTTGPVLVPLLGDQLSPTLSSLADRSPDDTIVLMMEVADETTYVRHHQAKIALILSAMRHFAAELRAAGFTDPIWLHGAMERMCRLYEDHGVPLGPLRSVAGVPMATVEGAIVICPPAALADRWSRRLPDPVTAMASGWMRVRQRVRQRGVDLPLVISDHADWDELTATIGEIAPRETWITHGREEALLRWCELHQRKARALALVGYEDEGE
jgi:putative mRNA 3-end processing factor